MATTIDPEHERCRLALVALEPPEQLRRIRIADHHDPDYVPSEVLASLVRACFGRNTGVLDGAVDVLYERLMILVASYFKKNPKWGKVVRCSSETLKEATSEAWVTLNTDKNSPSFAEVRFLPWVEGRVKDFLKAQTRKKYLPNRPDNPEHDQFPDEDQDNPEEALVREHLTANLEGVLLACPPKVRQAVYLRAQCEHPWSVVANMIDCSVPTARAYYKQGLKALAGANV
jgi:hypothetical protein